MELWGQRDYTSYGSRIVWGQLLLVKYNKILTQFATTTYN